jgi:hypothetical protein
MAELAKGRLTMVNPAATTTAIRRHAGGRAVRHGPSARDVEDALRARVDTLVPELLNGAIARRRVLVARVGRRRARARSLKVNRRARGAGCGPISARPRAPTAIRATCCS